MQPRQFAREKSKENKEEENRNYWIAACLGYVCSHPLLRQAHITQEKKANLFASPFSPDPWEKKEAHILLFVLNIAISVTRPLSHGLQVDNDNWSLRVCRSQPISYGVFPKLESTQ